MLYLEEVKGPVLWIKTGDIVECGKVTKKFYDELYTQVEILRY